MHAPLHSQTVLRHILQQFGQKPSETNASSLISAAFESGTTGYFWNSRQAEDSLGTKQKPVFWGKSRLQSKSRLIFVTVSFHLFTELKTVLVLFLLKGAGRGVEGEQLECGFSLCLALVTQDLKTCWHASPTPRFAETPLWKLNCF